MEMYKIRVSEKEPIDFIPTIFTGEFMAAGQIDAGLQAREYYAHELDTVEENIEIISIEKIVSCPVCDKPFENGTCKGCDDMVKKL